MKTCPKCGTENEETLLRCGRCGAKLPRDVSAAAADGGRSDSEPAKSHMLVAVLATLLFVPFGLPGLLQAAQVKGWYAAGQYDRAREASQLAQKWATAGVVAGIIINPILILAAHLV